MPDSVLLTLTLSAVALSLPAALSLLRVQQPEHAAQPSATMASRGPAATAVGAGGAFCAHLLGEGALQATAVALVLAASVMVQARSRGSWLARGVVLWALLLTAGLAFLAWLGQQVVAVSSPGAKVGGGVAWSLLAVTAFRLRSPARTAIARCSRREAAWSAGNDPAPVAWLVTGAAAMSLVLAFSVGATIGPEQPSRAAEDESGPDEAPTGNVRADRAGTGSPTADPSSRPTDQGPAGAGTRTGGSADQPRQDGTGTVAAEPDTTSGSEPEPDPEPEPTEATKTPGYEKEKPNRPSDAPKPGSGKPGR